ncbi:MAG: hypothetical protein R2752_09860 [Vicinamibacterales bacterium]
MTLFLYRMWGAALLDRGAYEGIEHDARATGQAAAVVLLASLAAGFGAGGLYGTRPATVLSFTAIAFVTWVAWAVLMFQLGTRTLPGPDTEVTLGELLRTIGFAASPGLLQVFAALPPLTVPVFVITIVWMIAAMVVAVRQALDYRSLGRAVAVCGLAAAFSAALAVVIGVLFGPAAS